MSLPVQDTLNELLDVLSSRSRELLLALILPIIVLVLFEVAVHFAISELTGRPFGKKYLTLTGLMVAKAIIWGTLAVSCHRLFLGDADRPTIFSGLWIGLRQINYMVKAIVVATPIIIGSTLFSQFQYGLLASYNLEPPAIIVNLAWYIFMLPFLYLSSRIALVLPATALRKSITYSNSWRTTERNGWRLVLLLWMVPFLLMIINNVIGEIIRSKPKY